MTKLSLDLSSVTTVAVDLAKHIFQVMARFPELRIPAARAIMRCGK